MQEVLENQFLSTPSARRATSQAPANFFRTSLFLSTPSARRATRALCVPPASLSNFYPRPPRGGRPERLDAEYQAAKFLSTPSARRATSHNLPARVSWTISIHALREEGDAEREANLPFVVISIHALREEGDDQQAGHSRRQMEISIHALREEGDGLTATAEVIFAAFLSTPSARRATPSRKHPGRTPGNFYPRPPRGGRRSHNRNRRVVRQISIHALREEGDNASINKVLAGFNFYPRPPRGGRQQKQRQNLYFLINYTTFCTNLEEP